MIKKDYLINLILNAIDTFDILMIEMNEVTIWKLKYLGQSE